MKVKVHLDRLGLGCCHQNVAADAARRRPFYYKPDAPFSSTTKVECQGLADLMLLPHFFIHWTAFFLAS